MKIVSVDDTKKTVFSDIESGVSFRANNTLYIKIRKNEHHTMKGDKVNCIYVHDWVTAFLEDDVACERVKLTMEF